MYKVVGESLEFRNPQKNSNGNEKLPNKTGSKHELGKDDGTNVSPNETDDG